MKILYAQPIFLPNNEIFEKNIQSVRSFSNVINNTNVHIDIELGGWSINDEYWNQFVNKVNSFGLRNLSITRFDKNYGKAYVVNKLTQNIKDYDYLLTADSDIIFKDIEDFIERIINVVDKSKELTGKPFGVMGLNQEIANCHMMEHLSENKHDFIGYNNKEESIRWHNSPSGIAGGCLFTSSKNWIECGGYREMGVYAGDDALFLLDTGAKGNSFFMCETISVIHPPENNQDYQEWKVKVCQRDSHGASIGIDDDKINEAQDFWK
jgi:hypothetical protein